MTHAPIDPTQLSRTPREVPLLARLCLRLGNPFAQIGTLALAIGLVLVFVFVPRADVSGSSTFQGELASAPGRIVRVERTSFSEGGGKNRKGRPVLCYDYEFELQGVRHTGTSWGSIPPFAPENACTVEFPPGQPERSRVRGLRANVLGPGALFVGLVPIVGIVLLAVGWVKSSRWLHLVVDGRAALGLLVEKVKTRRRSNKKRVYKLVFEFEAEGAGTQRVAIHTTEPAKLEDDAQELLLYDPHRPSDAIALDLVPSAPRFDRRGHVQEPHVARVALCLLLPVSTAIALGGLGLWQLFAPPH